MQGGVPTADHPERLQELERVDQRNTPITESERAVRQDDFITDTFTFGSAHRISVLHCCLAADR